MPFSYYDSNGFLAIGPTIPQWRLLREELSGDVGVVFVETGQTDDPLSLADEVDVKNKPEPVASLLTQLKRAAEKADTVLLITAGTNTEAQ